MSDCVVLEPKGKILSSAVKIMYLFVFILAAFSFAQYFFTAENLFDSIPVAEIPQEKNTYIIIMKFLSVFIFIHFIRMYTTLELLEEPTSVFHVKNISYIHKTFRWVEQLIRISLVLFISLKFLDLLSKYIWLRNIVIFFKEKIADFILALFAIPIPQVGREVKSIKELFYYLFVLYLILLSWDIVIRIGKKIADKNFKVFRSLMDPFFVVNISGLILSLLVLKLFPKYSIWTSWGLGGMIIIYILSICCDVRSKNYQEYYHFWKSLFFNLGNPFYGKRYRKNERQIYQPNNTKINYQDPCSADNCEFVPVEDKGMINLVPLDSPKK